MNRLSLTISFLEGKFALWDEHSHSSNAILRLKRDTVNGQAIFRTGQAIFRTGQALTLSVQERINRTKVFFRARLVWIPWLQII